MQIDIAPIRNKQRIYIGGTHGVAEIFNICQHVLNHIGKPVDFYTFGEEPEFTDAPVIIIKGGDEFENDSSPMQSLDIHILLVHVMNDDIPKGYPSFDDYVLEYEKLADSLPKAGSLIYLESDNVATMMGKKEREDVKAIEYTALKSVITNKGFAINTDGGKIDVKTEDQFFPRHAAGAKALLNRIGVSDAQFFSALKSLA